MGEIINASEPGFKCIAVEPDASPVLSGGTKGPHAIQGLGTGFVPEILNRGVCDEIIRATNDAALETVRRPAHAGQMIVLVLPS